MKQQYPTIPIGTKVKALRDISFMCEKSHKKGEVYIVEENTQSYFEVNHKDYEIPQEVSE